MRDVTIAPFEPAMADELVAMWRESFEHGVGSIDWHPIEEQRKYLDTEVLPHFDVTVAKIGSTLVGFIAFDAASINQLYVRVGHHRRGIGTSLLDLAKARSSGSLWLFTFAQNQVARRFYEKHGFVAVAHGFEPHWGMADVKYEWRRAGSVSIRPLR